MTITPEDRPAAQPTVVLIASQLLTKDLWSEPVAALQGAVQFFHAENQLDDTIEGMAARLLADAPHTFHLVAHGMGGFVAFEVMRREPKRVISLALLSTLAANDGPAQTERRQGYLRLVQDGRFDQVIEERIPMLLHPARREDARLLDLARRMADATGPEAFQRQQTAIMGRIDSRPSLGAIPCPTLLLWGRQDGISSEAHQNEMLEAIPHARLSVIENCGHLLPLEMPLSLTAVLKDWYGPFLIQEGLTP